ncbi:MAG: acyltransferase [Prevotella sp.]|nr:acyltransferase [Prevotella sp.]
MDNKPLTSTIFQRDYTNVLRGMAIILIMAVHAWEPFSSFPWCGNLVSSLGVAVFLFLSGYGLSESYRQKGLDGFIRRKFGRIVFPYWIWLVFTIPFREFNAAELAGNIFFLPSGNNYLYFIVYLIHCYAAFWLAHRFFPRHDTAVLALFSVVSLFFPPLSATKSLSFLAGCLASKHSSRIEDMHKAGTLKRYVMAATVAATVLYALKALPAIQEYKGTLPFNLLVSADLLLFTPAFIAIPLLMPALRRGKIMATAGMMSLELYMIHSAFVYCIASVTDVIIFYTASVIIATVFHRYNSSWLKSRGGESVRLMSILLYAAVCYVMALKYTMRLTPHFAYIAVGYLALLYPMIQLAARACPPRQQHRLTPLLLAALCAGLAAAQYHFDPYTIKVDRWSAIHNVIAALLDGEFPYLAQTHLGGYASPFPVWMVAHIPFFFLGNVGLSIIAATAVFTVTLQRCHGTRAAIQATLMLLFSLNLWYEASVRSDLITNFMLLAAFVIYIHRKGISLATHPWSLAVICGLWLSTRLTCALPLFIVLFPSWLRLTWGKRIMIPAVALLTFMLTFLPLLLWDADALLFSEYPPFLLQTRQGHPGDVVLIVILCTLLALWHRHDTRRLMFGQAVALTAISAGTMVHNMAIYNNWDMIFQSDYDITYLDMALPFLIAATVITQEKPTGKKLFPQ